MFNHQVGPQLSLSVYSDEYRSNKASSVLVESAVSFHEYHGTGSTLVGYFATSLYACLVKKLREGTSRQDIARGLDLAARTYQEACSSLCIQYFTLSENKVECSSEPIINDVDWYFDESDVSNDPLLDLSQASNALNLALATKSDETDYLEWIARGLHHCLAHEFAPLYNPNMRHESIDISRMALPMSLALPVARFLWDDMSKDNQNISVSESSLKSIMQQHLHVHTIVGLATHRCQCMIHSLVIKGTVSAYDRILYCARQRGSVDTKEHSSVCVFSRVVVVRDGHLTVVGDRFDESNIEIGNSQQARQAKVQYSISADKYVYELNTRNLSTSSYVQRIKLSLQRWRVDLVVCPIAMATDTFVDCLAQASIAVLGVDTKKDLNSAAEIVGCVLSEDLIYLEEEEVGVRPVQCAMIHELPGYHHKNNQYHQQKELYNHDAEIVASRSFDPEKVGEVLEVGDGVYSECLLSFSQHISNDSKHVLNEPILSEKSPCCSDYSIRDVGDVKEVNMFTNFHKPSDNIEVDEDIVALNKTKCMSVIICAPTSAMASAYEDRFYRCLHRLRAVREDSCSVMPGGGISEILCFVSIEEDIRRLSQSTDFPDSTAGIISTLVAFQSVLIQYLHKVMLNNGVSHSLTQERVYQTLNTYLSMKKGSESILDVIGKLSAEEKRNLPKPIDLSYVYGEEQSGYLLDPVRLKILAVQSAVMAVKVQLQGDLLI